MEYIGQTFDLNLAAFEDQSGWFCLEEKILKKKFRNFAVVVLRKDFFFQRNSRFFDYRRHGTSG
jgi:hypothetical protein